MTGIVSDIISFSLNDGPGIRTTVFFKGCPLRCEWCHNPETNRMQPQALYAAEKCLHCGQCASVCPRGCRAADGSWIDSAACVGCGACANACPVHANRLNGRAVTPEEVCRLVLRDRPFFRQRGGVTFSGGEPLMQPEFLRACAQLLHDEGIHCALETSCFGPWHALAPLPELIDLFLCDWKVTDPEAHRRLTGVDNALIRENLLRLSKTGARMVLRCPIIPGVNDTQAHFSGIAGLAGELPSLEKIDLLPYHDIGNDKRVKLGQERRAFPVPDAGARQTWLRQLSEMCSVPVRLVGGGA